MDMGWVVTFASPENPTAQITLLAECLGQMCTASAPLH
jgi:hypothetical protein